MSRLAELPEELISNISIKLGVDDVFALRLTCKSLEAGSLHEFATEYFSHKCFMFTSESLQVLVNIADSEKLRGRLHHVYFIPLLYSERTFKRSNGDNCLWKPTVRQSEAYRFYIQDQQQLRQSGRDKKMVAHAFNLLPAIESLTFSDTYCHLPETTDFRGCSKSWRTTHTVDITLPGWPNDKEYYKFKDHMWSTIIKAVANSGQSTLNSLTTDLDKLKNGLLVSSNLRFDQKTNRGLRNAFAKLKSLRLQVCSQRSVPQDNDDTVTVKDAQAMQNLATLVPAVEELDLAFTYPTASIASILCHNFTAHVDMHKLTKLKLDSLGIDVKSLILTISMLSSVQDLQLVWINVTEGSWIPVLKAIQKLETLNHLHLMYLSESGARAYFLTQLEDSDLGDPDDDLDMPSDDDESDDDFESAVAAHLADGLGMDDGSETDDDLPDLEPQDAPVQAPAHASDGHSNGQSQSQSQPHANHTANNDDEQRHEDFVAPGMQDTGERGYYICLKGHDEIDKQLPIFIKEYNLESDDVPMGPMPPVPPGGAGLNAILNSFQAAFGAGPPAVTGITGNAQAGSATFTVPIPPGFGPPGNGGQGAGPNGGPPVFAVGQHGNMTYGVGTVPMPMPGGAHGGHGGHGAGHNGNAVQGAGSTNAAVAASGGLGGEQAGAGAMNDDEWTDDDEEGF